MNGCKARRKEDRPRKPNWLKIEAAGGSLEEIAAAGDRTIEQLQAGSDAPPSKDRPPEQAKAVRLDFSDVSTDTP